MPLTLDWPQITLRLALTVFAGLIIGFNRGEHGRPAGMRTTLLVCLAAAISMIQANLMMNMAGRAANSFVMLDLMRLPLGILSGMGFIGAGAILRRDNLIVGVTTAATLWFSTVMGLCFGGGQLGLGLAALGLGIGTLWGLYYVEGIIRQDSQAMLVLSVSAAGPADETIRRTIQEGGCAILSWGIIYADQAARRLVHAQIQWRTFPSQTRPPGFVDQLAREAGVERVQWQPQGITAAQSLADSRTSAAGM